MVSSTICLVFFPIRVFGGPLFLQRWIFLCELHFWIRLLPGHLKSRGWNLANKSIICMCEEEIVDHLVIHCPVVSLIWHFFLLKLNVSWMFPFFFRSLIYGWWLKHLEGTPRSIWLLYLGVLWWGIWKERNMKILKGIYRLSRSADHLYGQDAFAVVLHFQWFQDWGLGHVLEFLDLMGDPVGFSAF